MATVVTEPAPDSVLASVPFDHRTASGLLLPHFLNGGRLDIERIRATFILIDGMIGGLPTEIDARFDALVGSAPGVLDTIAEISDALQNNPDVIDQIIEAVGLRATKAELTAAVSTLQTAIGEKANQADFATLGNTLTQRVDNAIAAIDTRALILSQALALTGTR